MKTTPRLSEWDLVIPTLKKEILEQSFSTQRREIFQKDKSDPITCQFKSFDALRIKSKILPRACKNLNDLARPASPMSGPHALCSGSGQCLISVLQTTLRTQGRCSYSECCLPGTIFLWLFQCSWFLSLLYVLAQTSP